MLFKAAPRLHADLIDFHAVPLGPQVTEAFGTDKPFSVLLRPDNYVAYISAGTSPGGWRAYLRDYVGCPSS